MNRKLISKAISDIDDVFIAESMFPPVANAGHAPERTTHMENTNQRKHILSRRLLGLILAACLVFTLAITAYAADIGGIQRIIQIWRFGDQTTAVLVIQDGQYSLTDEEGSFIQSGGGIAIEPDGSERPLTEEEILEHLDRPDLVYKEDGTVWVFYRAQSIEITDLFDADGVCYLELRDGEDVLYLTIKKGNGMMVSSKAYVQPWQFSITKEE